jgi:hypothetical protein
MENLELKVPKGQMCFSKEELQISDNVNIRFTKIGLGLLCFAMLAVTLKGLDKVDLSSWLGLVSLFAWLFPFWLLYSVKNTSDSKSIGYEKMEAVRYKKAHYGFKKPVLEILFKNEYELSMKRYIHIRQDQIKALVLEFKRKGINLKE